MRVFCSRYTFHFNALRNYLRKLERRPKWQHIRFTYDILSFLWSVQPLRVTPAYTGEKHNYPVFSCGTTRHPCVYGGKALRLFSPHPQQRITPAHAGKSYFFGRTTWTMQDHPRACGEKIHRAMYLRRASGSPPRMRGKVIISRIATTPTRITPAYAGKRLLHGFLLGLLQDHPRVCGEKRVHQPKTEHDVGSPPRMRGKVVFGCLVGCFSGITPAHAGKGLRSALASTPWRDHPRACGERPALRSCQYALAGSPPRMRGKGDRNTVSALPIGITPAHAGKGHSLCILCPLFQDHPRACGERGICFL